MSIESRDVVLAPVTRQPDDPDKWLSAERITDGLARLYDVLASVDARLSALEARVATLDTTPAPSKGSGTSSRSRRSKAGPQA